MFRSGRLKPASIIFNMMVTPAAAAPPTGTEGMRRRSADGTPGGGSPPAEQDLDYSTDEDLYLVELAA